MRLQACLVALLLLAISVYSEKATVDEFLKILTRTNSTNGTKIVYSPNETQEIEEPSQSIQTKLELIPKKINEWIETVNDLSKIDSIPDLEPLSDGLSFDEDDFFPPNFNQHDLIPEVKDLLIENHNDIQINPCSLNYISQKQGNKYQMEISAFHMMDCSGLQANKELCQNGITRSLHGVWPVDFCIIDNQEMSIWDYFKSKSKLYIKIQEKQFNQITDFTMSNCDSDSSKFDPEQDIFPFAKKCNNLKHEYKKHFLSQGYSASAFIEKSVDALTEFTISKLCVHSAQLNKTDQTQRIQQLIIVNAGVKQCPCLFVDCNKQSKLSFSKLTFPTYLPLSYAHMVNELEEPNLNKPSGEQSNGNTKQDEKHKSSKNDSSAEQKTNDDSFNVFMWYQSFKSHAKTFFNQSGNSIFAIFTLILKFILKIFGCIFVALSSFVKKFYGKRYFKKKYKKLEVEEGTHKNIFSSIFVLLSVFAAVLWLNQHYNYVLYWSLWGILAFWFYKRLVKRVKKSETPMRTTFVTIFLYFISFVIVNYASSMWQCDLVELDTILYADGQDVKKVLHPILTCGSHNLNTSDLFIKNWSRRMARDFNTTFTLETWKQLMANASGDPVYCFLNQSVDVIHLLADMKNRYETNIKLGLNVSQTIFKAFEQNYTCTNMTKNNIGVYNNSESCRWHGVINCTIIQNSKIDRNSLKTLGEFDFVIFLSLSFLVVELLISRFDAFSYSFDTENALKMKKRKIIALFKSKELFDTVVAFVFFTVLYYNLSYTYVEVTQQFSQNDRMKQLWHDIYDLGLNDVTYLIFTIITIYLTVEMFYSMTPMSARKVMMDDVSITIICGVITASRLSVFSDLVDQSLVSMRQFIYSNESLFIGPSILVLLILAVFSFTVTMTYQYYSVWMILIELCAFFPFLAYMERVNGTSLQELLGEALKFDEIIINPNWITALCVIIYVTVINSSVSGEKMVWFQICDVGGVDRFVKKFGIVDVMVNFLLVMMKIFASHYIMLSICKLVFIDTKLQQELIRIDYLAYFGIFFLCVWISSVLGFVQLLFFTQSVKSGGWFDSVMYVRSGCWLFILANTSLYIYAIWYLYANQEFLVSVMNIVFFLLPFFGLNMALTMLSYFTSSQIQNLLSNFLGHNDIYSRVLSKIAVASINTLRLAFTVSKFVSFIKLLMVCAVVEKFWAIIGGDVSVMFGRMFFHLLFFAILVIEYLNVVTDFFPNFLRKFLAMDGKLYEIMIFERQFHPDVQWVNENYQDGIARLDEAWPQLVQNNQHQIQVSKGLKISDKLPVRRADVTGPFPLGQAINVTPENIHVGDMFDEAHAAENHRVHHGPHDEFSNFAPVNQQREQLFMVRDQVVQQNPDQLDDEGNPVEIIQNVNVIHREPTGESTAKVTHSFTHQQLTEESATETSYVLTSEDRLTQMNFQVRAPFALTSNFYQHGDKLTEFEESTVLSKEEYESEKMYLTRDSIYKPYVTHINQKIKSFKETNNLQAISQNINSQKIKDIGDSLSKVADLSYRNTDLCKRIVVKSEVPITFSELIEETSNGKGTVFISLFSFIMAYFKSQLGFLPQFGGFALTSISGDLDEHSVSELYLNSKVTDVLDKHATNSKPEQFNPRDYRFYELEQFFKEGGNFEQLYRYCERGILYVIMSKTGKLFYTSEIKSAVFSTCENDNYFEKSPHFDLMKPSLLQSELCVRMSRIECTFTLSSSEVSNSFPVILKPNSKVLRSNTFNTIMHETDEQLRNVHEEHSKFLQDHNEQAVRFSLFVGNIFSSKQKSDQALFKKIHIGGASLFRHKLDNNQEEIFVITNKHVITGNGMRRYFMTKKKNAQDKSNTEIFEYASGLEARFSVGDQIVAIKLDNLQAVGSDYAIFKTVQSDYEKVKKVYKDFTSKELNFEDFPELSAIDDNEKCYFFMSRQSDNVLTGNTNDIVTRLVLIAFDYINDCYTVNGYTAAGMSGSPIYKLTRNKNGTSMKVSLVGLNSAVEKMGRSRIFMTRIVDAQKIKQHFQTFKRTNSKGKAKEIIEYEGNLKQNCILKCGTEVCYDMWKCLDPLLMQSMRIDTNYVHQSVRVVGNYILTCDDDSQVERKEKISKRRYYEMYNNYTIGKCDITGYKSFAESQSQKIHEVALGDDPLLQAVCTQDNAKIQDLKPRTYFINLARVSRESRYIDINRMVDEFIDDPVKEWLTVHHSSKSDAFFFRKQEYPFVLKATLTSNNWSSIYQADIDSQFVKEIISEWIEECDISIGVWSFFQAAIDKVVYTAKCIDGKWFVDQYEKYHKPDGIEIKKTNSKIVKKDQLLNLENYQNNAFILCNIFGEDIFLCPGDLIEINNLDNGSNDEVIAKIRDISAKIKTLRAERVDASKQIDHIRKEIEDRKNQEDYLHKRKEYELKLKEWKELVKSREDSNQEHEEEIRKIKSNYEESLKKLVGKIKTKKDEIKDQNRKLTEETAKELEKRSHGIEKKIENIDAQIKEKKEQKKKLCEVKARLKQDVLNSSKITNLSRKLTELNEEKKQLEMEKSKIIDDLREIKKNKDDLPMKKDFVPSHPDSSDPILKTLGDKRKSVAKVLKDIDNRIKDLTGELDKIKDNINYEEKKNYEHNSLDLNTLIASIDQCRDMLVKGNVFFKDLKELHTWISEVYEGVSKGLSQYINSDESLIESKDDIDKIVAQADEKLEELNEQINKCSKVVRHLKNSQVYSISGSESDLSLHEQTRRKVKKDADKRVEKVEEEKREKDGYTSTDEKNKDKGRKLLRKHKIDSLAEKLESLETRMLANFETSEKMFDLLTTKLLDKTVSLIESKFQTIMQTIDLNKTTSITAEQRSRPVKKVVKTAEQPIKESPVVDPGSNDVENVQTEKVQERKSEVKKRAPKNPSPIVNIKQNLVENGTDNVVETEKKGTSSVGSNVKQAPKISNVTQNLTVNITFSDEELKEFKTEEVKNNRDLVVRKFLDETIRNYPFGERKEYSTCAGVRTLNFVLSQLSNACEKLGPPKTDSNGKFIRNEKYIEKDLTIFDDTGKKIVIKLTAQALCDLSKIITRILIEPKCDRVRREIKPAHDRKRAFSIEEAKKFCEDNEKKIQAMLKFMQSNVNKEEIKKTLISKICKNRPGSMWRTEMETIDEETKAVKKFAKVQCGIYREVDIDHEKCKKNGGIVLPLSQIRNYEATLPFVMLNDLWDARDEIKIGQHNWFIRTHRGDEQDSQNFIDYLVWLGRQSKHESKKEWCFVMVPDDETNMKDLFDQSQVLFDSQKGDIKCFFDTSFRTWKQVERSP